MASSSDKSRVQEDWDGAAGCAWCPSGWKTGVGAVRMEQVAMDKRSRLGSGNGWWLVRGYLAVDRLDDIEVQRQLYATHDPS
jgi:hypothetical protein